VRIERNYYKIYLENVCAISSAGCSSCLLLNCFVAFNSLWTVAKLFDAVLPAVGMDQLTHTFEGFACNDLSQHQFVWIEPE